MKRQLLTVVLCVAMMVTACGSSKGSNTAETNSVENIDENESEAEEAKEKEAEASKETAVPTATVEEQVLVDQDGIKITATGLGKENEGTDWERTVLKLLVENNTDSEISVSKNNCVANGYTVSSYGSESIMAGKKANMTIEFSQSTLDDCGIEVLTDISMSFEVKDGNTYDTLLSTDMIPISISLSGEYEQAYDDSGDLVYDEDGVKIIYKSLKADDYNVYAVFYMENNTDEDIRVSNSYNSTSVNDFMVNSYGSCEVMAGTKAIGYLSFDDLGSAGVDSVDDIETIETCFEIGSMDSYTRGTTTPVVTIQVK